MNNPFHRAAIKAFSEVLESIEASTGRELLGPPCRANARILFEQKLEAQARAFDACKRGSDISMTNLQSEMTKALYKFRSRLKLDGDVLAAERVFNDHMKPHLEIRLW